MDIIIKRLTPELLSDYIDFFDNRAFSDNPEWSACYCVFYHWKKEYEISSRVPGVDIHEHNRSLASQFIKQGVLKGYLAYVDGLAMGWCNANDKSAYEMLAPGHRPDLWDDGDSEKKIKCVTCFAIAPAMRRKGLSTALLDRVCKDAVEDGYDIIEAYPGKNPSDMNKNYHGPYMMYEKAGFKIYKELEKESIVRRVL